MSQPTRTGTSHFCRLGLIAAATLVGGLAAQSPGVPGVPIRGGHLSVDPNASGGDHTVFALSRSVVFADGDLEIRAESAVITLDRDESDPLLGGSDGSGLPRRSTPMPASRRRLSEDAMRQRLHEFLRSLGRPAPRESMDRRFATSVFRSLYLEGNVVFLRSGVEVLRADKVFFSVPDDRAVFDNVVFRMRGQHKHGQPNTVVLRGKRLIRQGKRLWGRSIAVTTDTSAKPQFEVLAGELEVLEQTDDLEIRTRGNRLVLNGAQAIPLPDTSFYASERSEIPIKGFTARYSSLERFTTKLDLGTNLNRIGGRMHEYLTGRDASEFRGDWRVGLSYEETRGFPLDATLNYRGGDLYHGRADLFFLSDKGDDIREIRNRFDGSPITETTRSLVHTQNRVRIAKHTSLDFELFAASDPSVWSEFHEDRYQIDERPETRVHLRHAVDNRLLSVSGRWNLASYSYADDRALARSFTEELPVASFDWFSHPILELPGDSSLELSTSTNIGQRRSNFDSTATGVVDDSVWRAHQGVELAAPYQFGSIRLRPYVGASITAYEDTPSNTADETRWAVQAGAVASTRLQRVWEDAADGTALRHTIYPTVDFRHQLAVEGNASDYWQHDAIDAMDERATMRVGVLNRFEHRHFAGHRREVREFLWLDVGQTFLPIRSRDNTGKVAGLFDFEMILRPLHEWIPIPNLRLLVEGELDWHTEKLRTFNTAFRFGKVLGLNWHGSYRTDQNVDGVIGYGADTQLFGRWNLVGWGSYDLQTDRSLNYLVSLQRRDRNWTLSFEVDYDVITDDVGFRFNFEPSFGGLVRSRRARTSGRYGADPFFD